jgi:hypothetical protein
LSPTAVKYLQFEGKGQEPAGTSLLYRDAPHSTAPVAHSTSTMPHSISQQQPPIIRKVRLHRLDRDEPDVYSSADEPSGTESYPSALAATVSTPTVSTPTPTDPKVTWANDVLVQAVARTGGPAQTLAQADIAPPATLIHPPTGRTSPHGSRLPVSRSPHTSTPVTGRLSPKRLQLHAHVPVAATQPVVTHPYTGTRTSNPAKLQCRLVETVDATFHGSRASNVQATHRFQVGVVSSPELVTSLQGSSLQEFVTVRLANEEGRTLEVTPR